MNTFQGGFQDIWLYIVTPLAGVSAFFAWRAGKAGLVIGVLIGWLLAGALAYIDAATGQSIGRGAGALLGKLLDSFGI